VSFNVFPNGTVGIEVASRATSRKPDASQPPMIDEQLFQMLYRRTASELRAYITRVLGNPAHADDIVQESYLRLVRTPPATTDLQQLRAWLFRIASHLIIDHWRRHRKETQPDDNTPAAAAHGPDPALRLDMARMFEQLSPQQRQMLWLAYVEGADHREIAEALDVRPSSVRVLLHRARRKLATLLGDRRPRHASGNRGARP
jgi:RNA polymerase sigma-70 factor (ECF subfamily)